MSGFTRHRRSGRVIATFTGFEADLLRSLASQLVELLRNEEAVPQRDAGPARGAGGLRRADRRRPTTRCSPGCSPRRTPTTRRRPAEFRRYTEGGLRDGKAAAACAVIDTLEEAGLPPELTEDGLMIDVELDAAGRGDLAARPSPTCGSRWPPGSRSRTATRTTGTSLPDDDPRAQAHDIYEWVGYLQETLVRALW